MPYFIEDGSTPDWSENFSSLKLSKVVVPSVSNITELNLCNTQLDDITLDINLLAPKLVLVDLSYNQFTEIPIILQKCSSLQSLNMSNNNLNSESSNNISLFSTVTMLDLSHNKLTSLPPGLFELPKLSYLIVSHNQLSSLPEKMSSCSIIRQLFMGNNKLTNLPSWMSKLSLCTHLSLSNNPLGDLSDLHPHVGQNCRRLKYLDLSNMSMNNIPSSLCWLLDLRHLDVSNHKPTTVNMSTLLPCMNRLPILPNTFPMLVGLVKLQAVGVNLTELPDSFHLLKNLEILNISKNSIFWLPSSLSLLPKLRFFDMSDNNISMFPLDFEELPNLEHLLASYNRITELPEKLGLDVKQLVTLDMYSNQLYQVEDRLFKGGLVRCDFAMNFMNMENLGEEMYKKYKIMEEEMRYWEEDLGEGFVGRLDDGRQRTGSVKMEEQDSRIPVELEDYGEWQNAYDDNKSVDGCEIIVGEESEEISLVNQESDDQDESTSDAESDDWAIEVSSYELPAKFSFKHNLQRMDLELFWGKEQFCPADLHNTPRNEKIIQKWEKERRERQARQEVGRQVLDSHFTLVHQDPQPEQFEDAESDEEP